MATLYNKNANGEWVEALPTVFTGQFMMVYVEPYDMNGSTGRKYLDLSPYIEEGADFMLIMIPDYKTSSGVSPIVYVHSDGKIRAFTTSTTTSQNINTLDLVFPVSTVFDGDDFVFNSETRIMQYKYKPSSTTGSDAGMGFNKSLLIYAK